ncbi:sulfatase-like hydrolase/transferase [Rhodoferax sp.]|uniref:sulfatase-like hydrolase/transferase n=1 Tax=Rhodoferax sp. TaxID=50421 RepID=UPI0025DA08BD|nr:sulfatase-like hydrolase/transferase [Rhodoferax sp.]
MTAKNVLVIMSDEHDPRHMGCSGSRIVQTPNLDALAARGTRFASAYTPSPICVPARAAFATGRRVHEARLWDNASPYYGQLQGWGHLLQEHQVRVESVGKLHYRQEGDPAGFDVEHLPMHVVGGYGMVWASIRDPYIQRSEGKRMLGDRVGRGDSPYTEYDEAVTERTVQWLREAARRDTQPFALYVGLVAPHFPLIAPPKFYDLYDGIELLPSKLLPAAGYQRHPWVQQYAEFERNEESFKSPEERRQAITAYFGLCSFLDHNVGRILTALREAGLAEDTLVVYTSDHGDNLGARGLWGKSTLYQESVTIPMIAAGPDMPVGVCETPVDLLDLFPTILQGAGVDPRPLMDGRVGRSLQDVVASPAEPERVIFSEYHAAGSNTAGFMVRKGRWKYHYYVRNRPELFDLQHDPEELNDLAAESVHAAVLHEMEAELHRICDPEAVDALCKADQRRMIEGYGGPERAAAMGSKGATPAPAVTAA